MKVVVGLGNPGEKYAGTRHNVGFDTVEYLAEAPDCLGFRSRFDARVAELREAGELVVLVQPQTFMNLSGRSVRAAVDFYKLELDDLLVVCDDFNLPLGKLRARSKGSAGGQNGLKDIQAHLGTEEYARLRIGVGEPRSDAVNHVLGRFRAAERDVVDEAIADAARGVLLWVREGIGACMNAVNGRDSGQTKSDDE